MNKTLKKFMVILLAVICALSVQVSVSAAGIIDNTDINIPDFIRDILEQILGTTEPEEPAVTTTAPPQTEPPNNNQTTADNPINHQGTGSLTPSTSPTTAYVAPTVSQELTTVETTTEPETTTLPEEDSSISGSLAELLEKDQTHNVIVQEPQDSYTLGSIVVQPDDDGSEFTWQSAAIIAAMVLFVVLLALVVALLVQRNKKAKENAKPGKRISSVSHDSDDLSDPVSVEVMTPERIAELLGSSGKKSEAPVSDMSSEDSAAAIRAAALMGQLTNSYSDPLIRKYTDEPVMISPVSKLDIDSDDVTGAQILEATDSMLEDFSDDYTVGSTERMASAEDYDKVLDSSGVTVKICPECGKSVSSDDIFCHGCGAYVG